MAEGPDRYCGTCGRELSPEDQFCRNCGRPVHTTAHVPTPEADVSVPPRQQVEDRSVPSQVPHTRGRMPNRDRRSGAPMVAIMLPIIALFVFALIVGPSVAGAMWARWVANGGGGVLLGVPLVVGFLVLMLWLLRRK
jgi:hypothetical protein